MPFHVITRWENLWNYFGDLLVLGHIWRYGWVIVFQDGEDYLFELSWYGITHCQITGYMNIAPHLQRLFEEARGFRMSRHTSIGERSGNITRQTEPLSRR